MGSGTRKALNSQLRGCEAVFRRFSAVSPQLFTAIHSHSRTSIPVMGHGALTAIGLIVLAAIIKETIGWLFSGLKTLAASDAVRQKARIIFTKSNRQLIWTAAWLIFTTIVLINFGRDKTPLTRWSIVRGCFDFLCVVFWVAILAVEIMLRRMRNILHDAR